MASSEDLAKEKAEEQNELDDSSSGDSSNSDSDDDDSSDDSEIPEFDKDDPHIQSIIADLEGEEDEIPPKDLPTHQPKRTQKIKTILREYCQLSSTHGVDHMGEAHTIRVVMFWSLILLCCAAGFGFLFSDTIIRYLKFEVVVQISMKNEERMFPAVTICNLNPYKKSELMNVPELAALVQAFEVAIGNA